MGTGALSSSPVVTGSQWVLLVPEFCYMLFSVSWGSNPGPCTRYSRWSSTEPPSVRSSKPPSILTLARLTTIVFDSSSEAKFYWAVLCGDHILLRGDAECISLCLYKTDGMPKIMSTVAGVGSLAIWCYHVSSYQGGQRETRKATQKTQCGTLNRASECLVPSC